MRQVQGVMGTVGADWGEVHGATGGELCQARSVQGKCRANFRIAAYGLAVVEQNYRLAVGGYLDGAKTDALGQNTLDIALDSRPLQAVAHAVTAVRDSISVAEKATLLQAAEMVLLVAGDDTHC